MIRVIPRAPAPLELDDAHRKMASEPTMVGDSRPRRYDELDQPVQQAVWEHLYAEQHGRCAYCERVLSKDSSRTRIEHFHPRKKSAHLPWTQTCEARTLVTAARWRYIEVSVGNLLLCCDGNANGGGVRTCDASKGGEHICDSFFNVKHVTAPSLVRVGPDGTCVVAFSPTPGDPAAQDVVDRTLGLNARSLRRKRQELFAEQIAAFTHWGRTDHRPAAVRRREAAARLRIAAEEQELGSTLLAAAEFIERV